jgi:tetratricopeptide (TPR) repeat protein
MPLAILLAAAWVDVLSPDEIARELAQSLDVLTSEARDVPQRHRSVRAVFEPSWNRLSDRERETFVRLSVFRGGFTREAAQAVTDVSLRTLMRLVDKSLLHRTPVGRYQVHELLRQYAAGKLDEDGSVRKEANDRHAEYFADLLYKREAAIIGGEQKEALLEMDNIRSAWRWAVQRGKAAEILKSLHSLKRLYEIQGGFQEGEAAFGQVVEAFRTKDPVGEKGIALGAALREQAYFARASRNREEWAPLLQESLSILHKLDAGKELAATDIHAALFYIPEQEAEAKRLLEESLSIYQELDIPWGIAWALESLGIVSVLHGAYEEAERNYSRGLRIFKDLNQPAPTSLTLLGLGDAAYAQQQYVKARQYYEEGLAFADQIGFQERMGDILDRLGDVALAQGKCAEAQECYRQAMAKYERVSYPRRIARSLEKLASIALLTGEHREAQHHLRRGLRMAIDRQSTASGLSVLPGLATLLARAGAVVSPQPNKSGTRARNPASSTERAVELAALVLHHSESVAETKDKASELLEELQTRVPPAAFAAAQERGQARDLWATAEELLSELAET